MRLEELAAARVRYGCRRLHVLLRRVGWPINAKRVHRLHREEGLAIRPKPPKRKRAWRYSEGRPTLGAANEAWAMDFLSDQLFDGRPLGVRAHFYRSFQDGARHGGGDGQDVVVEQVGVTQHRGTPRAGTEEGCGPRRNGRSQAAHDFLAGVSRRLTGESRVLPLGYLRDRATFLLELSL
jgi:putative transposase